MSSPSCIDPRNASGVNQRRQFAIDVTAVGHRRELLEQLLEVVEAKLLGEHQFADAGAAQQAERWLVRVELQNGFGSDID